MTKRKLKLAPMSVISLVRELRRGSGDPRPLAISGARELVPLLARELRAGGDASAVVEGRFEGASVLVWIGAPDEDELRRASRAGVPIVAVTEADAVPYVLATDLVRVPPGPGSPSRRSPEPSRDASARTHIACGAAASAARAGL